VSRALPCLEPGCGRFTRNGSRCPTHQQARDQQWERQRPSRSERGYDHRWARLAREAIAEHPWGVDCGTPGDARNPLCGDHLVPLAKGGLSVRENVVVRCRRCNSRKGGR
jgi:5-methylcytosine-specific restriction protein A